LKFTDPFSPNPEGQDRLRRGSRGGLPTTTSLRLVGTPERGPTPTGTDPSGRAARPASDAQDLPHHRAHHGAHHGAHHEASPRRSTAESTSLRDITQSNIESAYATDLDPQDPRWLVAVETASQLEGSLLTFERRRSVLAFAHRVGIRPFDANLIIAAVQDRARRREPLADAMPTIALTAHPQRALRAAGRRSRLLSRESAPYILTAIVAVLVHAVGIGAVLWLLLG
jgi:hypothetical protein